MHSIEKLLQTEILHFFSLHDIDYSSGIVVAFSGGSDSLGMLVALSSILPTDALHAAYVNHRLRPALQLSEEIELNARNCESLGIPFSVLELGEGCVASLAAERGFGTEDAARVLRYQALEILRNKLGFGYIATAHTSDDQLETLLMRLLQGGSLTAMTGIQPVQGTCLRPVLGSDRETLQQLLRSKGLTWAEDQTNAEDEYLRNKIRHAIVPAVLSVFPSARMSAVQFAHKAMAPVQLLGLAEGAVESLVVFDGGMVTAACDAVASLPQYLQLSVVYRMWSLFHEGRPVLLSHAMAMRIVRLFSDKGQSVVRACGACAVRTGDEVVLMADASTEEFIFNVGSATTEIELPGNKWFVRTADNTESDPLVISIEASMLVAPIVLRTWHESDEIVLSEGTKKVSRLISQWKLPVSVQKSVCLLEDNSGIVAIFGRSYGGRDRLACRFKLGPLARNGLSHYSVMNKE